MHSVSSNAVARAFGDWELIVDVSYGTAIFRVYGKNTTKGKYLWFHLSGYAKGNTVTIGTQLIGLPTSWVNQNETRRCIIFADLPNGRLPADIDINPTGICNLYPALPNQYTGQVTLGYGLFGDAIVYMS
jgi:hypothetical protein